MAPCRATVERLFGLANFCFAIRLPGAAWWVGYAARPKWPLAGPPSKPGTAAPVHLSNDTLSIAFENTVFWLIPKENATISVDSVLK
jgi:hypothetical protein